MNWYNLFSNLYDKQLDKLYFSSRQRAVELLDLNDNHIVMDVACGTEANFKHIQACNRHFTLYGFDYSSGMLKKKDKNQLRKIWQTLETKTDNFHLEYLPVKENKVGGKLFVAVGSKRAN